MWRKRLQEQTHQSVLSVADQIARMLHSNKEYLPKKFECAEYGIRTWAARGISEFKYYISYGNKKKPFCIIHAHEYYFNGDCFGLQRIFCNDIDLYMLRDLQIQLRVYCGETRKEYLQVAQATAEAETSYKEGLLNV